MQTRSRLVVRLARRCRSQTVLIPPRPQSALRIRAWRGGRGIARRQRRIRLIPRPIPGRRGQRRSHRSRRSAAIGHRACARLDRGQWVVIVFGPLIRRRRRRGRGARARPRFGQERGRRGRSRRRRRWRRRFRRHRRTARVGGDRTAEKILLGRRTRRGGGSGDAVVHPRDGELAFGRGAAAHEPIALFLLAGLGDPPAALGGAALLRLDFEFALGHFAHVGRAAGVPAFLA